MEGTFLMIELKALRKGKKVKLSPHQIAFHLKHADIGAPTFILVEFRPPMPSDKVPEIFLFGGHQAEEVARLGLDAEPLGRWPARAMQWHMLRHALLS